MNSETYLLSTKVFVNKTFKIWTLEQFRHALFEMFAKGLDNTIYHYLIFCRDTTIRIQKMDFHSNNDHAIKILKDSKNNIYIQSPNAYSLVAISIVGALPVSTLSWDNYNDDTSSFEEILPLFTVDEWVFMINTFNSTLTDEMFCANKGAFIACCEDAEKYEGGATILNMDLSAFINKINSLKGANIEAIYSRIKDYWSHSNEIDLNEWAKF